MSKLKENLIKMMKAAGDDTSGLAAATGIPEKFIKGIVSGTIDTENGDELAPVHAANKLARRYGVTIDNLINTDLVPVTIFAPRPALDWAMKNPEAARELAARVQPYVAPTIRDIGVGVRAGWGESIATSATSGATSGATAGVVAYSVAGPTPLPGPE